MGSLWDGLRLRAGHRIATWVPSVSRGSVSVEIFLGAAEHWPCSRSKANSAQLEGKLLSDPRKSRDRDTPPLPPPSRSRDFAPYGPVPRTVTRTIWQPSRPWSKRRRWGLSTGRP
jgi:hypothetical protein